VGTEAKTKWVDRMEETPCTKGNTTVINQQWVQRLPKKLIHTWLVQTLLKATNEKVCANIVEGRSFFANKSGSAIAERNSCGMKAKDSRCIYEGVDAVELKYKILL
jgi:hypothetical protein